MGFDKEQNGRLPWCGRCAEVVGGSTPGECAWTCGVCGLMRAASLQRSHPAPAAPSTRAGARRRPRARTHPGALSVTMSKPANPQENTTRPTTNCSTTIFFSDTTRFLIILERNEHNPHGNFVSNRLIGKTPCDFSTASSYT